MNLMELALLGEKARSGGTGLFLFLTAGQKDAADAGDEPGLRVPYGGTIVMRVSSITQLIYAR